MKKEKLEDHVSTMLNIIFLFILVYFVNYLAKANSENIWELLRTGFMEFIRYFFLPFIFFSFTAFQFILANKNREMSCKKNLIDLEDKTIKEFGEIKEILEAITVTTTDSYKDLLINLKVKDKSVEEKLLDKMEGKRFKFTTKYDNEEIEYKKQIKKMHGIIVRNIENTQFFLEKEETLFNLSQEDIHSLKNNSKKINEYFINNYKKKTLTSTEEIYLIQDIKNMLDELKHNTGSNKIESIKKSLDKVNPVKNSEISWVEVQNAAKSMIEVIDKI